MCGILGFTNYFATSKQIICATLMAAKMVERGRQSWGTSDGIEVIKDVGPITETDFTLSHFGQTSLSPLGVVFGHTRASSHGSITKPNAHPHMMFSDDATKKIIGIHNGTVVHQCMEKINTKKFEVDTQVIYDHLVNGLPTDTIEGTGVLVYMQDDSVLRFLRFNSTNLYVARDLETGGLIWASTKAAVVDAAKMAGINLSEEIVTKSETIYEVRENDDRKHLLVEIGEQKFSTPKAAVWTDRDGAQQFRGHGFCHGHGGHQSTNTTYNPKMCRICKALKAQVGGISLCVVCEEVATDPMNTTSQYSFTWWGHYTFPTEDTSGASSDSEEHPPTPMDGTGSGNALTNDQLIVQMHLTKPRNQFGYYLQDGN